MNPKNENQKNEFFEALSQHISQMEREIGKMLSLKHNPHFQLLENEKIELIVCLN